MNRPDHPCLTTIYNLPFTSNVNHPRILEVKRAVEVARRRGEFDEISRSNDYYADFLVWMAESHAGYGVLRRQGLSLTAAFAQINAARDRKEARLCRIYQTSLATFFFGGLGVCLIMICLGY